LSGFCRTDDPTAHREMLVLGSWLAINPGIPGTNDAKERSGVYFAIHVCGTMMFEVMQGEKEDPRSLVG